jgi:hypothetical protein
METRFPLCGLVSGRTCEAEGVSLSTVQDFERGQRTPIANNIAAMRRVIEAAGVRLVFDKNGTAAGILRQDADPDLSRGPPA